MANPIITCSVSDVNSITRQLTGDSSVLIRYFSDAAASMSAKAQGGAAINEDMYIIRNGSKTGYGSSHTFRGVESNVFTFSAEDSDGNIAQKTLRVDMVDYIKLTCNVIESRPDASGNMVLACYGEVFNDSFGRVPNSLDVFFRYRVSGGSWSSWSTMSVDEGDHTYTASAYITGLNYQSRYEFEYRAVDALMEAYASAVNVKSLPVFHWSENDVQFEVPIYFVGGESDGDFRVRGNLKVDGEVESSGSGEYGEWLPDLLDGSYAYLSRSGWYSKVGNVVTVGFYIKAASTTGYEQIPVRIGWLPYYSACSAAGGGMCSGALVSTDKNFQCFVVEKGTDYITLRGQDCDGTDGGNLTTSAIAFRYPSGTEMTVSGTITYMTE